MEQSTTTSSVCREFYEKFPHGKERVHKELVRFLANHPSSRKKLKEWILSEETRDLQVCSSDGSTSKNGYDDLTLQQSGSVTSTLLSSSVPKMSHSKCDIKSKKERELGNEFFKKKNLEKSLYHYNQAIKYSHFPKQPLNAGLKYFSNTTNGVDDTCLSIALANRSAVFYELGDSCYGKALKDIDLARKCGYPERLKTKLITRKARIVAKQVGNRKAAQECREDVEIIKARQLLCKLIDELENVKSTNERICLPDGNDTENQKINEIEMQIEKLLHISHVSESSGNSYVDDGAENFSENIQFESACDSIFIKTSEELGRHVIASTDLNNGDILFKELPFASVLLPEFYSSHCHHCHKSLHGQAGDSYFFPCKRCTQVLFCDDLCADAAELYHVYECGWLDLLHSVGIAHLAIRIILVAGVEEVLKCTESHSTLLNLKNLNMFKQGMNNYHRVYSLVDHINDMFEEDLFQYSLTAGLLTQFLISKSSFLNGISEEKQFQVGGALLRHICQLICNAHAVTDVLPDEENVPTSAKVIDEYQKRIATAIFPAASIMNHSCDSNIMFYFTNGKQLIVKGARRIEKGENVYNCYGPHYRRMPRAERQEILLQQYFFTCDCDKCLQELHDKISFADQFQALKCDECEEPIYLSETSMVTCANCGRNQNIKIKIKLLNTVCDLQRKGDYLLEQGRIEEATEVFHSCYVSASKILFKCNSQFGKICDSLARCSVMTGKLKEAKQLLEQSLKYVEVRFGKTSLEYSRESQKYLEVCAEC